MSVFVKIEAPLQENISLCFYLSVSFYLSVFLYRSAFTDFLVYVSFTLTVNLQLSLREAAKKVLLLIAGPLRGREGGKGRAIKEKQHF